MSVPPTKPEFTSLKTINSEFLNYQGKDENHFHTFNVTNIWNIRTNEYLLSNIVEVTLADNSTIEAMLISIHLDGIIVFPYGHYTRNQLSSTNVFAEPSSGGSDLGALKEDGVLYGWSPLHRPSNNVPPVRQFTTSFPCIMFNAIKNEQVENVNTVESYISLYGQFSFKDENKWLIPTIVAAFMVDKFSSDYTSLSDGINGPFTKPDDGKLNLIEQPFLVLTYLGRKPNVNGKPFSGFDNSLPIYPQLRNNLEIVLENKYDRSSYLIVNQASFGDYVRTKGIGQGVPISGIMNDLSINGYESALIKSNYISLNDDKKEEEKKRKAEEERRRKLREEEEKKRREREEEERRRRRKREEERMREEEERRRGMGDYDPRKRNDHNKPNIHINLPHLVDSFNQTQEILREKIHLKNSLRHDSEQRMKMEMDIENMKESLKRTKELIVREYAAIRGE